MRYTAEQIQDAINKWQVSSLSKKAFCHQHDICPRLSTIGLRINQSPSSGFTEVTLPPRERAIDCEIIFPSGARMIFGGEPQRVGYVKFFADVVHQKLHKCYLYRGFTDMQAIDSLCGLVRNELGKDPMSGELFIFFVVYAAH
jgi:hypothetical protein